VASDLRHSVKIVKIGPELWVKGGKDFVARLVDIGFEIFLDLKFHDIPTTVYRACRACASLGVSMLTVHTLGGAAMLQAALEGVGEGAKKNPPRVLGVTILTSLNSDQLSLLGMDPSIDRLVKKLAQLALGVKLDGVVASAQEASVVREACGKRFLIVTPGIRSVREESQDQKRIATPQEAFRAGADYIVVGRPVFEAKRPQEVIKRIMDAALDPREE
jgi:orotidine-5'-phosphate decarboxylase